MFGVQGHSCTDFTSQTEHLGVFYFTNMKTYSEKLKDPRWQKKRLEIFQRDNWSCTECNCKTKTLHVHHENYTGNPWDAPYDSLLTLCEDCHKEKHGLIEISTGDTIVNALLSLKMKICEPLKNKKLSAKKQEEILKTAMLIDKRMIIARRIYG